VNGTDIDQDKALEALVARAHAAGILRQDATAIDLSPADRTAAST
jgi:hypothetical protein